MSQTLNVTSNNTGRVKPRGVSLISFNSRSLRTNLPELREFVRNREIDLLLIQETWLKSSIVKGLSIPKYTLLRNDRKDDVGYGGTAIYYKKALHCSPLPTPTLENMEATVCRLAMTGHRSLIIASVYISPKKPPLKSDFEALLSLGDSIILFGDFNSKHTDWTCSSTNPNGKELLKITQSLDLDVLSPYSPTHYPDQTDHTPDVLDFALVKGIALNLRAIEPLDDLGSDHRPVSLVLGPKPSPSTPSPKTFTNWEGFKESLALALDAPNSPYAITPDYFDSTDKIDSTVDSLTHLIQTSLKENEKVVQAKDHKLPLDVSNLIKAKNAALRRASLYPTPEYRSKANRLQRQVRSRLSEWRNTQWGNLMENISPSHVAYYKVAKALRTDAITYTPPLIRPDGTTAFEDAEKAECFADSIASQCSPSTQECDPVHIQRVEAEVNNLKSQPITTDPLSVSTDEIQSIIKGLKVKKAPGMDGISNQAIKHLPFQVLNLLILIFNACFDHCYFPKSFKEATVIGIPKPGKPLNIPSSHRPISLLKTMSKLFERIILSHLKKHLFPTDGPPLIIPHQFGFRAKHSCPQQVHRIVEFILSGFYPKRKKTIAVFFDVAKAFDKVWHDGLIYKLFKLGLSDRLTRMVASYLENRTFRFRHEGTMSSPHLLKAGVPQGSALSPLLYSVYTNDIPIPKNSVQLSLFADDTALYVQGQRMSSIIPKLQTSVNELAEWFKKWRIDVNPDKSSAIRFDVKRRNKLDDPPVRMQGTPVPWQRTAKYLGVLLDMRLTFGPHIQKVTRTARFYLGRLNSMLGRHSKMSLRNKRTLYKVCIRPVMTYAAPVFAHASPNILDKLQVVQNLFCRRATNAQWCVRNSDLHRDLNLPTIQQFIKSLSETFFKSSEEHPNPLIREAAAYTAPTPSRYRIRRPRNVLSDPPNQISADLNRLLAAQDRPLVV